MDYPDAEGHEMISLLATSAIIVGLVGLIVISLAAVVATGWSIAKALK